MNIQNKLFFLMQGIFVLLFSINTYAGEIDTKGLPEEVTTYIQQRELCNQAREILIHKSNAKKQILDNARREAKTYCMGKDQQYQKLIHHYKSNLKIIEKLILVNGMGDIVSIDAPIQFGQTIDVLMPNDIVTVLPQLSNCLHLAGEFGGDNSKEDREVANTMDKLKCGSLDQKLRQLEKNHQNDQDALMFIKALKTFF